MRAAWEQTSRVLRAKKSRPAELEAIRAAAFEQYVYIIRCNEFLKIGRCKGSAALRLCELQVGNPYPLELVAAYPLGGHSAAHAEVLAHYLLKEHAHRGEWFTCSPEEAMDQVQGAIHAVQTTDREATARAIVGLKAEVRRLFRERPMSEVERRG